MAASAATGAGATSSRRRLARIATPTSFVVARLRSAARRWPRSSAHAADSDAMDVPSALDLLAACLCAGASPVHAVTEVASAIGGCTGMVLGEVGRLMLLGAPVDSAWSSCLADPHWAPVARAVIRAHDSGASLTDVLSRVADDRRRALRTGAEAATRRAGVKAVLPLGLCFLPAFVLVGVVPVIAGFAHAVWA